MIIDGNEKEGRAILAARNGDKALAHKLEQEFIDEVKASGEDHCNCKVACRHHGDCVSCVIVHRGHRDHLPFCFHDMVNERLVNISLLTEHSVGEKIGDAE